MAENTPEKIKYGRYKSYDSKYIYVFDVAMNVDIAEKLVLYYNSNGKQRIYYMSLSSFLGKVEIDGKIVERYTRDLAMPKPSLREQIIGNAEAYICTYYDYAKEILTEYNDRQKIIAESRRIKRPYEVTLQELKDYNDDNTFLRYCLKTQLSKYKDIAIECFINDKSIREYAAEKNINRGSVEHLRKKLIAEFAQLLAERDRCDKRNRLLEKKKSQSDWVDLLFDEIDDEE